jgi:ribosomal protein L24
VIEKEGPIHISNVMLLDPKERKPTRVGRVARGRHARARRAALGHEARLTMPAARLKTQYQDEIRPALIERFGYTTPMQAPRIEKNRPQHGRRRRQAGLQGPGGGRRPARPDRRPAAHVRRARKSIAAFKLREGMPVGVSVTLRRERAYEFLDR